MGNKRTTTVKTNKENSVLNPIGENRKNASFRQYYNPASRFFNSENPFALPCSRYFKENKTIFLVLTNKIRDLRTDGTKRRR